MDVIVTGASGLIGSALRPALAAAGHRMIALVRRPARGADEVTWDPPTGRLDRASIEGAGAAVHLAGVGIAEKRWTDEQKRALRDSRVQGTGLFARAIAELNRPPAVLVERVRRRLLRRPRRRDPRRAESARRWVPARPVRRMGDGDGSRRSTPAPASCDMRTGIVLSKSGGALRKQLPLFNVGLGGRFGSGRQWQSWITIDDVLRAIQHLFTADVAGPVNLTTPHPVTERRTSPRRSARCSAARRCCPIPKFGPSLVLGSELTREPPLLEPAGRPEAARGLGLRVRSSRARGTHSGTCSASPSRHDRRAGRCPIGPRW